MASTTKPRVTAGDRIELENRTQRQNYREGLERFSQTDGFRNGIKAIQAKRQEAALAPLVDENIASRAKLMELHQRGRDKGLNAEDLKRYGALVARYGSPNASDVHIDSALTNLAAGFGQGEFIGLNLMPIFSVTKRTGKIFKYRQQDVQHADAGNVTLRAPGSSAQEIQWDMASQVSYDVETHSLQKSVPDELVEEADDPIDVRARSAAIVREAILQNIEIDIATLLQTAGTYPSGNQIAAATTKWDDADTTDNEHLDDIQTAQRVIANSCGMFPTDIAMNIQVAQALIRKDDFMERVKYVSRALDGDLMDLIAAYCGVQRAHVSMARKLTSNPGQSTETYGYIWSDAVVLLYQESPSTYYKGFGLCPATDVGTARTWRHYDESRKSDVVNFEMQLDPGVVTQSAAGAILQDVLT